MTLTYAEAIQNAAAMSFLESVIALIIVLAVLGILVKALEIRKTKKYRVELSDMYVAGKIKQIAEEDKIDLNAEYNKFKRWAKEKKLEEKDLRYDEVVEEDLKERILEGKETPKK